MEGLERKTPQSDGSPLESFGEIITISLDKAIRLANEGEFKDMKTELGLRRHYDR